MSFGVSDLCASIDTHDSDQTLAIVLSSLFLLYLLVDVTVAAIAIANAGDRMMLEIKMRSAEERAPGLTRLSDKQMLYKSG